MQLLFMIGLFLLTACENKQTSLFEQGQVIFVTQQHQLIVEMAKTAEQRKTGLMFRKTLKLNAGMLFVFKTEVIQRVWMKNTFIPLDIIFISQQGEIVSFIRGLKPCIIEPCTIYNSKQQVKYMLEVNAGFIDRLHLKQGAKVLIN